MNILFILNDAPSAQRSLSALRLACVLSMRSSIYVRIFLIGAAVACARHRDVPARPDDAEALLHAVIQRGGTVRVCATSQEGQNCCAEGLVESAAASSLEELARWIPEADRLMVF